jgi:Fe-S cluster assembly ATPase SufC
MDTMSIQDPFVQVSGLRKTHRGGFEALRGIDFEIERGETFALLGPNGAGKSTTIENLEGYRDRDPSAGEAPVLGDDPRRAGLAQKARLGVVLELRPPGEGRRLQDGRRSANPSTLTDSAEQITISAQPAPSTSAA